MENPTRQRQLEELDQVELCTRILYQARNELYVKYAFPGCVFKQSWI